MLTAGPCTPTPVANPYSSNGWSTVAATPGPVGARPAPTPIPAGQMPRARCSASSSSIRTPRPHSGRGWGRRSGRSVGLGGSERWAPASGGDPGALNVIDHVADRLKPLQVLVRDQDAECVLYRDGHREHANPWGAGSPGRQSGKLLARGSEGSGAGAEPGVASEAGCGTGAR